MSVQSNEPALAGTMPVLSLDTVMILLVSGAIGTVAFDIWGQVVAPLLGLGTLAPVGLARSLLGSLGLPNAAPYGHLMHLFVVGLVAYPLGWLAIFRPLQRRVLPAMPWLLSSATYGVGLWVFAIGGVTVVAGLPFFLNFATITWVALGGHVIYAIAAAATAFWIERGQG